ncbi:MAG: PorP/SprF family type IX secretion system membrane protein, partial [Saprospiraceae bacterium]|nr:PorP/SprF family type IX secretion system membrane protein [Saprospiraceae bacterium]
MKIISHIVSLVIFFQVSLYVTAQDWHFSQFHSSPVVTNPAFTGLFNGDLRVIGNVREQWSFAAPYKTFSISADGAVAILKNGDFASAGVQVIGDKAGDLDFSTLQAAFCASYSKALSGYGNHFLTLGMQAALNRRSINYANVVSFDPEPYALTGEDNFTYADLTVGGMWYFLPSDEIYAFAGLTYF